MERRMHPAGQVRLQQREENKPPVIVGYAAVFWREGKPETEYAFGGWFGKIVERIMPGAFDRTILEDDVRGLFNHCPDYVLGRNKAGTMKLSVDEIGLQYEIVPPDAGYARDLMASLARQDITGSSFAFDITKQMWIEPEDGTEDPVIRELHEIKLWDVGPVTFPAYSGATAGIRARDPLSPSTLTEIELFQKQRNARRAVQLRARAVAVQEEESLT